MSIQVTVTSMSFGQKIVASLFTYSMLLLCIYVSQGSTWWTFVTGFFFILCFVFHAKQLTKDHSKVLKTKDEVLAWANSLPDDSLNIKVK